MGDGQHGVSSRRFLRMIRKSGHRIFLATNAKRLRGDHAQPRIWSAIVALLELYDTVCGAAEGNLAVAASACPDREALTVPSQGCRMAKKKGTLAPVARRIPMADKGNDPVALWQKMIGEMEKGFNAFANQTMSSPEFSKAMNQAGGASAGAQRQFGEFMEKYLLNLNLPSRVQMIGMAERLQNIEGQLNEIKVMLQQMNAGNASSTYAGARPPRTKRPPVPPADRPPKGEQK
jgi:hypothetical protein